MPSIRDVANKAGVSTATVSHVLNQTRFVSDETRQKVIDAIQVLDYSPSLLARGLARNKSQAIGVVFSDISNPYFTSIFKGIESELIKSGYDLILANTSEEPGRQEEVLAALLSRRVDGLILAPTGQPSERLLSLRERGLPIVLIDRGDTQVDLPIIGVDNQRAAYEATRHLLEDGHREIGILLGLEKLSTSRDRQDGFLLALAEANIEQNPAFNIQGGSSQEGGFRGTLNLMAGPRRPTALFSTNNTMTLGMLHAFRSLGIHCPQDVGVIGFDDHPWADIFTPPLSVICQPTHELGITAAKLLRKIIEQGYSADEPLRHNLAASLVVRGSCSHHCNQHYLDTFLGTAETNGPDACYERGTHGISASTTMV